jgi:phenylacetate-CoA ligase
VRFLKELPPFFLHVYPSSLFSFIDLVGEQEFRKLKIRGVLAGSESFPPAQIEHFRKRFGLKVAHWYGHGEYATLAFWCEECLGFHFYPTYGYTELVPTEDGRLRIVATSFNRIGTRFLRYDTGDIAYDDGQACRRPFLRVSAIEGREQEYFIGKDGLRRAFGPYLFGIHDSFWETIRAIQFRQSEKGAMRVAVAIKQGKDRDSLESYLRERFGTCDLEFDYVEEIPKTLSGKHRYYITSLQ